MYTLIKRKLEPPINEMKILSIFTYLLYLALDYFTPIKDFLYVIALAIATDYFMGVWKASHFNNPIKGKKALETFFKSIVYFLLILLMYQTGGVFSNGQSLWVVRGISVFLLYTELQSIDDKFKAVKGKSIIKAIKETLPRIFKKTP